MKPFYFLMLFFISLNAVSQQDTLFPNAGAYWYVKYWYGYPETIYSGYSVETSANKILYNDTLWYTTEIGYLLVDSTKIYFKSWDAQANPYYAHQDTMTHLLYNFNLQIGDTAYFNPSEGYPLIVLDIDTSYFLGVPRRALYLGSWGNVMDTWIQGLGSDKGLFYPWSHTFEAGSELCFFTGDFIDSLGSNYTLIYDNPDICESLNIEESINRAQVLFGRNQIHFLIETAEQVRIYDLSGKLIYNQKFEEGEYELSIDFLRAGIYFLKLGESKSQKFFKL